MEYKSYKDRKMALPNLRYFVDSCESQLANLLDSLKGVDPMRTTSVERWEERLWAGAVDVVRDDILEKEIEKGCCTLRPLYKILKRFIYQNILISPYYAAALF